MNKATFWRETQGLAEVYSFFEQHITIHPARALVAASGLLDAAPAPKEVVVLDNACGTGIISSLLNADEGWRTRKGKRVIATDVSPLMVDYSQRRAKEEGWTDCEISEVDSQNMASIASATFTHVLVNFGIFLMPDPFAALDECFRVSQASGWFGMTSWDVLGWLPLLHRAIELLPSLEDCPRPPLFQYSNVWRQTGEWHEPGWVKGTLEKHGFVDTKSEKMSFIVRLEDGQGLVDCLSGAMIKQITGTWSDEQQAELGPLMPAKLEQAMRELHGGRPVELTFVALVTTGRKP